MSTEEMPGRMATPIDDTPPHLEPTWLRDMGTTP